MNIAAIVQQRPADNRRWLVPSLPLSTDRLLLAQPGPDDASRLLSYAVENRDFLAPWEMSRSDRYFTLEYWEEQVSVKRDQIQAGAIAHFLLFDKSEPAGPLVGQCALSEIVRGPFQAAYLGYSLDRQAYGKGLMHEALTAVIEYAFDELKLHRLMANYMPTNERSGRVLRRLGFSVEGYARDYLKIAGRWEDHILTALTNPSGEP